LVRGAESGTESGTEDLINQAASIAPGSDGLLFLPYLAGERSPIWDPLARGAFVGLTLSHQRPHLVRAILEAAAFALRHVATPIVAAGLRIDEVRVSGGTARSDIWNQIKADVLGVPVAVPEVPETAVLGAAIIAAQGIGWHAETLDAIRSMVRIHRRLEPNLANRAVYDTLFAAYVDLWPAISPIVHRLHRLPGGLAGG
jgi:xylulokinase